MREPGYYWVKLLNGKWLVGEWDYYSSDPKDGMCFYLTQIGGEWMDKDFEEIDENRIVRGS